MGMKQMGMPWGHVIGKDKLPEESGVSAGSCVSTAAGSQVSGT